MFVLFFFFIANVSGDAEMWMCFVLLKRKTFTLEPWIQTLLQNSWTWPGRQHEFTQYHIYRYYSYFLEIGGRNSSGIHRYVIHFVVLEPCWRCKDPFLAHSILRRSLPSSFTTLALYTSTFFTHKLSLV